MMVATTFIALLLCGIFNLAQSMSGMGFNSLDGWPVSGVTNGRIWDMGVAWNQIHSGVDTYNWAQLDAVVGQMRSLGMKITYVVSACPQWLAKYPDNPYYAPWVGPGSNSMPSDIDQFNNFIWNLATRYAGQISAYEIWNEPQLSEFLYPYDDTELGTLATMTQRAYSTIKSCDPNARVVAASVLPRASSGGMSKASQYLSSLQANGWNVDLFNTHIYPEIGQGTDVWGSMLQDCISTISSFGPPTTEVWVTETNYDLGGPVIAEDIAPSYVNGTYDQASAHGVSEVYWYAWNRPDDLGGLYINLDTAAWSAIAAHA